MSQAELRGSGLVAVMQRGEENTGWIQGSVAGCCERLWRLRWERVGGAVGSGGNANTSLRVLQFRNAVRSPGQVYAGQRGVESRALSNMESVALFVKDVKDHNVTSHPDRGIPSPPWTFLLFARKCLQHSGWCALLVSLERSTRRDSPSLSNDMV